MELGVVPAYGRDYKSSKDVAADVLNNKDFIVSDIMSGWNGKYVNLTDAVKAGIKRFTVRYNRLRFVTIVDLPKG